jgi:hypothetical protein
MRHRKGVTATERGCEPLRSPVSTRRNRPLTCGDAAVSTWGVSAALRVLAHQSEPIPSPRVSERRRTQTPAASGLTPTTGFEVLVHACRRDPASVGHDNVVDGRPATYIGGCGRRGRDRRSRSRPRTARSPTISPDSPTRVAARTRYVHYWASFRVSYWASFWVSQKTIGTVGNRVWHSAIHFGSRGP